MNFDKMFGGMDCVINSSWLSFVGDQDHKADTEIFEQDFFYGCGI